MPQPPRGDARSPQLRLLPPGRPCKSRGGEKERGAPRGGSPATRRAPASASAARPGAAAASPPRCPPRPAPPRSRLRSPGSRPRTAAGPSGSPAPTCAGPGWGRPVQPRPVPPNGALGAGGCRALAVPGRLRSRAVRLSVCTVRALREARLWLERGSALRAGPAGPGSGALRRGPHVPVLTAGPTAVPRGQRRCRGEQGRGWEAAASPREGSGAGGRVPPRSKSRA